MAAISGGVAEAYYGGVPNYIERHLQWFLDDFSRPVVSRMKQKRDEILKDKHNNIHIKK
jgi:hypothetical protein